MTLVSGYFKTMQPVMVLPIRNKGLQPTMGRPSGVMLPVGSMLYLHALSSTLHTTERSPLGCRERIVRFRDVGGVEHLGWIAANTPLSPGSPTLAFGDGDREPLSAWDDLRDQLFARRWTVTHFCGRLKASEEDIVRAVIRELGGAAPRGNDRKVLALTLLRTTHAQEDQMSHDVAVDAAPAKSTKKAKKNKKALKATKKGPTTEGRSAARSCGEALIATGTGNGKIKAFAARLQKDEALKGRELIELRDLVKEAAAKAREDGKDNIAAKLSAVNRLVRRLARAAA